jgi:putative SOS response-associated peptidase YedK
MCGRLGLSLLSDEERELQLASEHWLQALFPDGANLIPPNFDVRPTQHHPVIMPAVHGSRLDDMRWGWRPPWSRSLLINARCEMAATKVAWRQAFLRRRCVVPATLYYEWKRDERGRPVGKFAFRDRAGKLLLIAGLWTIEPGKEGPEIRFIVLTRTMVLNGEIHDQTPLMLTNADAQVWIDSSAPAVEVPRFLASRSDEDLVVRQVIMGAEKHGKVRGPEVAKPMEAWPWET